MGQDLAAFCLDICVHAMFTSHVFFFLNVECRTSYWSFGLRRLWENSGPNEVFKLFASLQPLFKDNLFLEGFIGCLADSSSPRKVIQKIQEKFEDISSLLCRLRSKYNELLELQAENHLRRTKVPDANFILNSFALGNLNDSKSDSTINKVVQQMIINFSLCSHK